MESYHFERARFRAYGNQLIDTHIQLRDMLDDLRDGVFPPAELRLHCLALCSAVTRHHTAEDTTVFPILAERHPELRDFLRQLERDHGHIAYLIKGFEARGGEPAAEDLTAFAAMLETHFRGEEKRLVAVLNALDPDELGPIGLEMEA